ncbi:MAG TPA: TRAP transporter fused permease subunit [Alphaproteobacteria bacterium]
MDNTREAEGKFRTLQGAPRVLGTTCLGAITIVGCLWALEIHNRIGWVLFKEQFLAVMLGLALIATFIGVKPAARAEAAHVPWYDWLLALLSVVVTGFVAVHYETLVHDLSSTSPERWTFGALAILLVAEATRRLVGTALVVLAAVVLLYARFGDALPGLLAIPSSSWERIAVYSYLDTNGLFGIPLDVAATTIVSFVLFGGVLKAVKGDSFITDLALVAMGRYRGGQAKVSIGASTLFGTVSGSAVSNVAVVGPITIPMMIRAGYPPHIAAAIEAVASTGGQIMPPVMGITAFLIADFLSISYGEVVLAAIIPALLYYLAIFIQADLEAARRGLKGLPRDQLPVALKVLKAGYAFFVPLAVLIYTVMVEDWQPGLAGMAAASSALLVGVLRPSTRPTFAALWEAVLSTGRIMIDMLILTAIAGIVIGGLQLSGVSFNMSTILLGLAGENVLSILVITGIVCIILGMALPTAVIYTMLAVLVAPALTELGVVPIAAHLFLFYMGMLSMVTPPVCFATFAAASIARASFWQAGLSGMRFGVVAYIVPFVFPFSQGLIMRGGVFDVALCVATAVLGVFGIAWGLAGYLFRPLGPVQRILLFVAGVAVLPAATTSTMALYANIVGLAVGALVFLYELTAARRLKPAAAGVGSRTGQR